MKLDVVDVKKKLNLSVGNNQVEVIITNNPVTERGHIFETDGLFLITCNAAKINSEKELDNFIKYVRNKICGIETPVVIEHKKVEKNVSKLPVVVQKKRERKPKINNTDDQDIKLKKISMPKRAEKLLNKRGRPVGVKNKKNENK